MKERIKIISRNGIKVFGFFMIGFPDETREQIEMTLKYAKDIDIMGGSFSIYNPFPGTKLYDDLISEGRIDVHDIKKLDSLNYENNLSKVSSKELYKIRRNIFYRLYLRPRTLFFFLRLLRSPYNLFFHIKNVLRQYFGFLK